MGNIVRVCNLSAVRKGGLECGVHTEKCSVNDEKIRCNLSRAKSKVREYVLCNDWDYFCTLTLSPERYDRHNLKKYIHDLSRFIQNYNRYCSDDEKVRYLFIPEMHKDGSWHLHGFIRGIRERDMYINSNGYTSWTQYDEKFGYLSFSKIADKGNCSKYALKYITKDSAKSVTELGNHIYYCSKGLNTSELLYRGKAELLCEWDYETEDGYCRIKELPEDSVPYLVRYINEV